MLKEEFDKLSPGDELIVKNGDDLENVIVTNKNGCAISGRYVGSKYSYFYENYEHKKIIKIIYKSFNNHMPFAPNKNATELGIDKSRKFRVVGNNYPGIPKGTIIKLIHDDYTASPKFCRVDNKSLDSFIYLLDLEYADDEPKQKFKVGDKVKAIDQSYGWGGVKKGDIGVIREIKDSGEIIVNFPKQSYWSAKEKDLELAEEETFRYTTGWTTFPPEGFLTISPRLNYSLPLPTTTCSEPIKKKTFMQTLSATLKRVLNPQMQSMYKAGLIDGDLALTDKGTRALLTVLLEKYETELANIADEIIKEEEKSCK